MLITENFFIIAVVLFKPSHYDGFTTTNSNKTTTNIINDNNLIEAKSEFLLSYNLNKIF